MTVLITLTVAGADSGPFNLFSDATGYTSAFATGITKSALIAGYASSAAPNSTTIVRVQSIGDCTNYIDIALTTPSTTTTSSSSTSSTTTCATCCDVLIGTQIWTSCNLSVGTYRDGTPIPEIIDDNDWLTATTGAFCRYDNSAIQESKYGRLYNWYAINGIYDAASLADPLLRKEFAPAGYHIPSQTEWLTLKTYLGGSGIAGAKMKTTGSAEWDYPNAFATNSSGFSGRPGGMRGGMTGFDYVEEGNWAVFWGLGPVMTAQYLQKLESQNGNLYLGGTGEYNGLSVRLIKD